MSIRTKISLLLSFLAAVMFFQSFDRVLYLAQSTQQFERMSEQVQKFLAGMDTLTDVVFEAEEQSSVILSADRIDRINAASLALSGVVSQANDAAVTLGIEPNQQYALQAQLASLSAAVDHLILVRSSVLSFRAHVEMQAGVLKERGAELLGLIQRFESDAFEDLINGATDPATSVQRVTLLSRLKSLMARIDDVANTNTPEKIEQYASDVQAHISVAIRDISQMPHFPLRVVLAQLLGEIQVTLSGKGGLSQVSADWQTSLEAQRVAQTSLSGALVETSATVTDFVRQTEEEISDFYSVVADVAAAKLWREIVVNAGLGLGTLVAVWIVFARQISHRLEHLTSGVLRLASGDLSAVVPAEGNDELSRMTSALAVFRENAWQLRRSNEELANFAYVASHDLRTPLRAIRDLVDWTLEDHADDLAPIVKSNLVLVRGRADRLSRLLKDLLDYARAGHDHAHLSEISVSELVDEIGELIDTEKRLALSFSGETFVVSHETPLRTILMNLIGNAIKHADRDFVSVSVSVSKEADHWTISVMDDGPGIAKKYQEQVFELFKTLKSRDEVDSSGLGLALVQKLTAHLEGSITIVSDPDVQRGTAFILRIPLVHKGRTETHGQDGLAA